MGRRGSYENGAHVGKARLNTRYGLAPLALDRIRDKGTSPTPKICTLVRYKVAIAILYLVYKQKYGVLVRAYA